MAVTQPGFVAGRSAVRVVLSEAARNAAADVRDGRPLVLVACSGGADSLALAACAAAEAHRTGVRVGAVVVDHDLHTASAEVSAHAAEQCRGLGLDPVRISQVQVSGPGGLEAAARDARYAALESARADTGADVVLLGHTLNDQAETVLLGLARGSGARSLAGMPPARGALRRPFLTLTRATTEQICRELGLTWWTDPTNIAPDDGSHVPSNSGSGGSNWPLRSRIRSALMPALERVLGADVQHALARSAEQLREDDDALRGLATDVVERALIRTEPASDPGGDAIQLTVTELAREHPGVRRRALHLAATRAGASPGALSRTHILALDALVTHWHGQGPIDLPGRVRAHREYGRLVLNPHTT